MIHPHWQVSVTTSLEGEETVAALLRTLFGQSPTVFTSEESRRPVVTVYASALPGRAETVRAALADALRKLEVCGWAVHATDVTIRKVAREDWSESWKKYFKTIELGRALLIKPSWSKRRPRPGQAVVVLDPGLSFGTGQHPTTSFCLCQLLACRNEGRTQSFLDIGTGSGILAIAAAKLRYGRVRALDNDAVAVRVARANARRNRVVRRVSITKTDLRRLALHSSKRYDVICANLTSDLLIAESTRILSRLKPNGRLVLAGVLSKEFDQVQQAYEAKGMKLVRSESAGGWRSGAFERRVCFTP